MKDTSSPSPAVAIGMPVMAASAVLFSLMSFLIPFTHSVSTSIIASARFVTGIAVILGISLVRRTPLRAVNRWWLVARGVIGATSVYFFYRGIMNLGLGKGTILNYTYPIFAALLAPLIIKEKLSWDVLAAGLISFLGIWLVVSPGRFSGIGIEGLLALLGGVLSGIAVVAIKKLRETDSPFIIYLAQCVFGLLVVGWPTATSSFGFAGVEWLILLAIGIGGHGGPAHHDLGLQARPGHRGQPARVPDARAQRPARGPRVRGADARLHPGRIRTRSRVLRVHRLPGADPEAFRLTGRAVAPPVAAPPARPHRPDFPRHLP